ncbi:MAG TPA: acyltransferase [Vicinamibacterales bacterium]|nr:acyltransferase [Vicinamibacterales bacterium]
MGSPQTASRIPAFDWLRVLAVLAIFFGHVAYIFGVSADASIRNTETSLALSVYGGFVYQWAVPLLFLLAGASGWCSLQNRTSQAYLRERVRRLLIPLLFGSVVLIPWIGYMSALNHDSFAGPYWQFFPIHFARTWAALQMPQHHHGLIALYDTSWHLWFLGYLLLFSALSLALQRGPSRVPALVSLCQRRGGLLLLVLPMVAVRMALGAAFPAYTDWSDTIVFFICFVYGRLFMTDARFLRAVARDGLVWLAVGCAGFALILATFALGYFSRWNAHPGYTADYLLNQVLLAVNTWAWVLALVAGGLRWLSIDSAARRYVTGAVLPFYILHQVAVATIGTIAVEWHAGVAVKFVVISAAAFAATMVTYECFVRRSRPLRVLFGVKAEAPALPFRSPASTIAIRDGEWNARSTT